MQQWCSLQLCGQLMKHIIRDNLQVSGDLQTQQLEELCDLFICLLCIHSKYTGPHHNNRVILCAMLHYFTEENTTNILTTLDHDSK